jgi:AraC-like DNA-binding protein
LLESAWDLQTFAVPARPGSDDLSGDHSHLGPTPRFFAREALRLLRFVDRPGLAESVGLSPLRLGDPEETVPISQYYELWEAAAGLTGNSHLGLHFVASRANASRTELSGIQFLLLSSPTFEVAFERLARYQPLWNPGESYEVTAHGDVGTVRFRPWGPPRDAHRHIVEKTLATLVLSSHALSPGGLEATAVRIAHPRPTEADRSEPERLLGVHTTYDAPHNQVEFPAAVLAKSLRGANDFLFRYFDNQLGARIDGTTRLRDRVKRDIAAKLHEGSPSAAAMAKSIGCSARTLQRNLLSEGTSLRELVDEVRQTRAMALLGTEISLTEVAFLLGYAEMTNFSRAFRRWTGCNPTRWRHGPG